MGSDLDPIDFDSFLLEKNGPCQAPFCSNAATHEIIDLEVYGGGEYCFACACEVRDNEAEAQGKLSEKGRQFRTRMNEMRERQMISDAWERSEDAG